MGIEVRPVADVSVLEALGRVLAQAFAYEAPLSATWFERAGTDRIRVAHDGRTGEVVGGLITIPMGQAFGGRFVPMTGLAGVGVRADRRRQGVASELLRQVLLELWEANCPLSTLYASNHPLYRGAGYEQAGGHWRGTMSPRDIDVSERQVGSVEQIEEAHRAEVEALYRVHALSRPGHVDRGPYVWNRIWRPLHGGPVHGVLMRDEAGALEAYVLYSFQRGDDWQTMTVVDAVSVTHRGWIRIWSHLRDVSTMVREIRLTTAPSDPLYLLLRHPGMRMELVEPFMMRVVDAKAALEARGYAKGQPERLVLRILDPLLGDQSLTVDVEGGRARVRKGGDPTARIHIRGLAAMYAGYLSPYEAASIGLVEAGTRSLGALQALFAGPTPWMRDFF